MTTIKVEIYKTNRSIHTNRNHGAIAARAEMNSHADTTCAGAGFQLLGTPLKTCTVAPFIDSYAPLDEISMGTCITAWNDPFTHETFVLAFHQSLFFGEKLKHSLINPNQLRKNGLEVNDCPTHLSKNNSSSHSIICEEAEIPLDLNGVISYFPIRNPSDEEKQTADGLT